MSHSRFTPGKREDSDTHSAAVRAQPFKASGLLADLLVHRQFLALIPGQRAAQLGGQLFQRGDETLTHGFGGRPAGRDVDEDQVAGAPPRSTRALSFAVSLACRFACSMGLIALPVIS